MADGEILAPDMEQETAETLNGSEQFVMFDTEDGKRATLAVIADYIVKHGEIDGDTIEDLIEAVENEIGTLANLSTTAKTNIVAAINEVVANQGALSSLSTTAKTTLVAAINELVGNEGALSALTTTAKNTLVAAINEVNGKAADLKEDLGNFKRIKVAPNDTMFFNYANIVSLFDIDANDFATGRIRYYSRNSLGFTSSNNEPSVIWIPLNLEIGKTYEFKTVFSLIKTHIDGDPNCRLYNNDTFVTILVSDYPEYITPSSGDDYKVRIYLQTNDSVDLTSIYCKLYGDYDYIKPDYIDADKLIYKKRIDVVWVTGGMNSDGTINTVAGLYHLSEAIELNVGDVLSISSGKKLSSFKIYDSAPTIGTSVPVSSVLDVESYTATTQCWACMIGDVNYDNKITLAKAIVVYNPFTQYNTRTIYNVESIVSSIEKEVITTQIETVSSARNAANFGVLPSNDAVTNTTNMQSLLNNGGTIIVDVPGTYLFNQLTIYSNTELLCGEQVIFSKQNQTGPLIINSNAVSREYNNSITIKGLQVAVNGNDDYPYTQVDGLRGILAFFYVKNLKLIDITCTDIGTDNYFIHIAKFEHVLVDNLYAVGDKDGIHISGGKHLKIINSKFATNDDPIALNAHDYITGCPNLNWIEDVIVENCVDMDNGRTDGGYFARILGGAWSDWQSGNQYHHGDAVVATNGYVYRLWSTLDGTLKTSTVEPTHTTYTIVTESDGCAWLLVQKDTQYNCGVKNLAVRNCYIERKRENCFMFHYDTDDNSRSYYPGSNAVPQKNILFDNVIAYNHNGIENFMYFRTPIDVVRITNCKLAVTNIVNASKNYTEAVDTVTRLIVNDTDVRDVTNLIAGTANRNYKVDAIMNIKDSPLTCMGGTVTYINDDLTQ